MDTLNPNKRLKEEFVSNLTGSSFLEISALATLVPVLMLLRHSIHSGRDFERKSKKNDDLVVAAKSWSGYMAMLLADFLLIVFPTLLLLTVLAEELYQWVVMMAFLLLFRAVLKRSNSHSTSPSDGPLSLRENISSYRVSMMIITSLSILAVDFTIFPRRYAKAETYGSSLMDVGVGSFVLANSLVSRQARNVSSVKLKNAVKSTSPLIILGLARLLSTKGVDYQVHVGEYGVHWNFFFTLAAIALLTSLINVPPKYCGILGAVILVGYQICLMRGLNSYLLSDERGTDLISQNKEGIFSIFEPNLEMGAATEDFMAEMKRFMEKQAEAVATAATTMEIQTAAMEAMKKELRALKEECAEEVKTRAAGGRQNRAGQRTVKADVKDMAQQADGLIHTKGYSKQMVSREREPNNNFSDDTGSRGGFGRGCGRSHGAGGYPRGAHLGFQPNHTSETHAGVRGRAPRGAGGSDGVGRFNQGPWRGEQSRHRGANGGGWPEQFSGEENWEKNHNSQTHDWGSILQEDEGARIDDDRFADCEFAQDEDQ